MRAVWSLWTEPLHRSRHPGWLTELHHLLAWVLSFETARRHYPETCLIADSAGKSLLVDELGLDFADVVTDLDDLAEQDPDWWAISKLHAHARQPEPFVHIDCDVFLWKPLPPRLEHAAVFAQNPEWYEYGRSYYRPEWIEHVFGQRGGWLPEEFLAYAPPWAILRAENCGIIGGQRIDFIRHYAHQALNIINHQNNQPLWSTIDNKDEHFLLIEQFYLSTCIDYHRYREDSIFSGICIEYLFSSYAEAMRLAKHAGYTHLLAGAKRNRDVLQRMERHVRIHYPNRYRRCLDVVARRSAAGALTDDGTAGAEPAADTDVVVEELSSAAAVRLCPSLGERVVR